MYLGIGFSYFCYYYPLIGKYHEKGNKCVQRMPVDVYPAPQCNLDAKNNEASEGTRKDGKRNRVLFSEWRIQYPNSVCSKEDGRRRSHKQRNILLR
jgi:hypothetical protein